MPLATGHILNNRYRIVKLLGQGGFGAVYRAWDVNFDLQCALKENTENTPEGQRQFQREAQMLHMVRHPNLPLVKDYFAIPNSGQYLVMDYVEGDDLQMMLDRQGALPEAQALGWVLQICGALSYLHAQTPPIIHRDIKPANIKVTPLGQAMLVDFGIAKTYDPNSKTTQGARAVTHGYSPPEQYGQGRTDARSDIYSLGATLYTLLTGQVPPDSVDMLTGSAPLLPPAKQINSQLSVFTSDAVAKAMTLNIIQRYQAIDEFKVALNGAVQKSNVKPNIVTPTPQKSNIKRNIVTPTPPTKIMSPSNVAGLQWVLVPAGEFLYGDGKKRITIPNDYYIGKYPVTNAQYKMFIDANPRHKVPDHWDKTGRMYPQGKERHPVAHASWYDAKAFCDWAGYRLPTKEEWEKAARGTDGRTYPWGNQKPNYTRCNFDGNENGTTPVGKYSPQGDSPYGCADMSGNVLEWTASEFDASLHYISRGGSWSYGSSLVRVSYNIWGNPDDCSSHSGFRCAFSP
jgi:serine/threonine protein kinase